MDICVVIVSMNEEIPTLTNDTEADRQGRADIPKQDARFPRFPLQALLVSEWHFRGKIDYRFEYFFLFLRVSPSYLHAHKVATGEMLRSDIKIADFELV